MSSEDHYYQENKKMKNNHGKVNILAIISIVLFTTLLATFAWLFIPRMDAPREKNERPRPLAQQTEVVYDDYDRGGASYGAKDYVKDYTLYDLDNLIVNPVGSDRYLVLTIQLEHRQADKKLPDELKNKTPLLMDELNLYFSKQTIEDLKDVENRAKFKDDTLRSINRMLLEGRVTDVFFPQFVVQ